MSDKSAASALTPSPYIANPVAWMHFLPNGEPPGWAGPAWMTLEESVANIWGAPLTVINTDTQKTLQYFADFEQVSTVLRFGFALAPEWALDFAVPFASRGGGILDPVIDKFHVAIDANRFRRDEWPYNGAIYQISTGGTYNLNTNSNMGVGNVKGQLRWWPVKWGRNLESCPCGVGLSAHVKVPVDNPENGFTSGYNDYSLQGHLGVPLGVDGSFFLTIGGTYMDKDKIMSDWPRHTLVGMADLAWDLPLSQNYGLIAQLRLNSPLMDEKKLSYQDPANIPDARDYNRMATAWNSLVYWRVNETLGVRRKLGMRGEISFTVTEDYAVGTSFNEGEWAYVNNAPDIQATVGLSFVF